MRIACSSVVEGGLSLPAALARMKELGFRQADVFAFEGFPHLPPSALAAGDGRLAEEFVDAVGRTGIRICSFNCGFSRPVNDPRADSRRRVREEYLAVSALAGRAGCPNLTVQTGGAIEGRSHAESLALALEGLQSLRAAGGATDGAMSFEPHAGAVVEDPTDALAMVKELWPAIGVTYDPSHFVMRDMPLQQTEALLDYTVHVHVRNAASGRMQAPMAEGTMDFPWLIAALTERGYDRAVSIEYLDSKEADALRLRDLLLKLGLEC